MKKMFFLAFLLSLFIAIPAFAEVAMEGECAYGLREKAKAKNLERIKAAKEKKQKPAATPAVKKPLPENPKPNNQPSTDAPAEKPKETTAPAKLTKKEIDELIFCAEFGCPRYRQTSPQSRVPCRVPYSRSF